MRALAPAEAVEALRLLAEVYRRARRLWPLNAKSEGQSVTVRIDQIKELSLPEIQAIYADGDSWLLSKRNNREAVVERHPLDDMAELMRSGGSPSSSFGRAARARGTRAARSSEGCRLVLRLGVGLERHAALARLVDHAIRLPPRARRRRRQPALQIAAAEHAGARVRAGLGGGRGDRGSAGRGEPATDERTRRPPRVLENIPAMIHHDAVRSQSK